jgi:nicotinate-nucleotide pyrophosphorylase (carboxylating)
VDFLDRLIDLALEEDLGAAGDVTTSSVVAPGATGKAELLAKEPMTVSGLAAFTRVFHRVDSKVEVRLLVKDGDAISQGTKAASLSGSLASLLIAERTALNLVQRASGIATLARQAVDAVEAVKGSKLKILDTRKTSPGMRGISKEAVRHGGAQNHRFGLFDGVLIKDNHIAAAGGSITEALKRAKAHTPRLLKIEVEVTSIKGLEEAVAEGADVILLDNMDDAQIAQAVKVAGGKVELEASGNVTLERLPKLAQLGVDFVSMGALTHSARAMDFSLEFLPMGSR